ncbi:hypothetical protein ACRRTK_025027 [Alexandromys fortis]
MESSQSATRSIESLPPPLVVPRGHLTSTKGSEEAFPAGQGNLDPHKPSQGPLEHVTSPQEMLHSAQFAAGTLQVSTHSKAVPEPYTNSQFTQVTSGTFPSVPGHLGLLSSIQTTPPSSCADVMTGTGEFILSAKDKSLDLSVSAQGTLATLLCNQGTRKHPASSQNPQNTSQSVQNSLQYPPSVPGSLKPSQSEKSTLGSLSSPAGIGISSPGSQEMFQLSASSGHPEPLLYFGLPLELSMCAQGTLCPFSSPQGELDPLHCFSGNLESSQPAQMNVSHVSSVREPVGNSPSVPDPREPSPFITKCLEDFHHMTRETLGLYSLGLGSQATSQCAQGTVGSCLSPQESMELSTSAQRSLEHPPPAQRLSGTSSHTQLTCSQSMSAQSKAAYSSSTQYLSHHAKKTVNTLKSDPGFRIISITAQASVETLLSPQESPRYSSSIPGVCKISTATRGHVVSDDGPLELFISAQANLSPFHSSQCLLKPSLSVERTFGLSTPMHGTLGPSVSSLGNLGSRQYAKSVQQTNPSASDSLGSMPSSKGQTVISLSGQGTLSTFLEPLKISLSVHGFQGTSTSAQEVRKPSLDSQGRTEPLPNSQDDLGLGSLSLGTEGNSQFSKEEFKDLPSAQGGFKPALSTPGVMLQNLSSSKVTLETSSSLQKDREGLLDLHGAQQFQAHSPGYLGHCQYTPQSSETLTSPQMVFKCSESSSQTLETLPPLPGTLGHSLSSQSAVFPFDSDQQIQESSSSLQKSVQFSPSSKGSLRPTPSVLGTSQSLLSAQSCPKLSISAQGVLGSSPPQQGCLGDSLSMQGALGTSISAQEIVGHSKSDQESPEMFISSQENPGPSLFQEALVHSSSLPQDCGLSQSSRDMLGTSLSTQGARRTPSSVHVSIVTVPLAQSVLEFQTSLEHTLGTSQLASETTKPLPSSEEVYSILKSLSRSIETLTSILETLTFSTFAKGAASPSKTDQVILRSPTVSHKTLEFSPSDQQSVKTASSQMRPYRTSLTDKGLQEISSGEKVPLGDSPLQQICSGNALSKQGDLGLPISAQEALGYPPSAPGSPDSSLPPEEASGTCLEQGHLGKTSASFSADSITGSPYARDIRTFVIYQRDFNISDTSPGTSETFPSIPGSLEISFSAQSSMGPSVSEKEIIGSSVSLEESLGHSFPDKGSLRSTPPASVTGSLSSSEQGHSPSDPGMLGRSDSDDRTLENPPFTQSILEIQFSNNGVAETSTTSQDSLGHLPPSVLNLQPSLIPETSEPLPTAKEVCKTSESALGALEPLPSFLEALRHLNSDQCTLGPSVYDQGNLEPSTPLHNTIGNPKPSPSVLEPISSTQKGVGTFFSTELLGLSTCPHDDFIPIHSHRDRLRYSFYPNKSHRCSNSTKKIASHTPFPEGDIRYSLLELDALRSFPSAKSRLTSSIYVRKDSSSTSTPPRSVSPPESSELTFRSSSPPKEDLRCSPSPRGSSRHLKSKKTKLKQAPKESGLKSVPSEDEGLKFHHSPTRIEASECKSNKESLEKSNRSSGHSSEHQKWTSSNLSALNRMTEHQPAQVESMGLVVTIASGTVTPMGQSLVMRSGWLSISWSLTVGTRLPSSLDPNEEERVQGALLIQKAWMFAWLVHAELTAETARDWPVQALGHPFQVQLSSSVRFLRPTVIRVLCASATGHVHSSREAEPLSEDIALLLLAESHQWQRPQFSQPPRPGTLFSGPRPGFPFWVPQWDDDILSQWGKRFPHRPETPFRGRRPGTPFSVSQGIDDSAPQWKTYLTSTKFPRDFAPPGVLRLARHKFRCQNPYKDKTAKIPYAGTADSLRSLRALIKITSSKRTLGPLKELKEMKKGQVLLPPEVPDCRSNPLSREPRPSVLPPATRKRGASTSVHRPRKVQRILDMSTVFEEPTNFDHSGTRETPSPLLPVHGTLELPQYGSEAVPSMPSLQGLQGSLSPLEGSIASVLSVHGSLGHSLSAQDSTEIYKSTKATPGQFLSSLDDMSHFMYSQETLGSLSSVEVDVGTYSHNTGSPGQLKNISGFPGSMISDHDPVLISLPVQGTLRHLPSAKEDVGLSLSTQQPPELSTLEQGSIQQVEASKVALVNPSSPKRATGKLQCAQYALEHLPPSEGALQHSSTHQGTQESLKSSLESLEILSSNSEHVKNSLSATGGLESSLSGSRVLGYELADKHPEQHSIYSEQGSLGNPLSTQEVQEHLVPLKGNLKSCQSAKEGPKTLIPSQIVLESVPSISEDLEALSSALERMRLSSLANESLENSQYAESVVESSSPATGTLRTTFAQKSLENSLPGKGMKEILSSFPKGLWKYHPSKGELKMHHPLKAHVKEALIPALSDQETKESLLSPSKDTEHPPSSVSVQMQQPSLSTRGPQDSLLTPPKPRKLSISVSDSLCPLTSSQESATGTVALSTLSLEYLEPIQSAQGELEYFSTIEQGNKHSSTASKTTRKLFSPQEYGGHLSSDPSVQEPFQSGPMDVATFLSSQEPQKPFKLTEALLYPSTSGQECQEQSETSQDVMGTHKSSESIHGYILPEVEPVVTFTAVSGTKVTSPSAPQPLKLSSLLHVTSATSLTDQRVVGPRPPSQGTLELLSLEQGMLEPLASPQGNERNSQIEQDTVEQSFSVQGILGSSPRTTGVLQSSPYAHKLPEIVPSTQKDALSLKESLLLPISTNRTFENLQSDCELTKHSNSFQEASRHSLLVQGPLQESPSASETLSPSFNQGIPKSLLSSTVYSSKVLRQHQYSQNTLGHLSCGREGMESSQSATRSIESLPPPLVVPRGHLTSTKGSEEAFPAGQGNLDPHKPSQGPLEHVTSPQEMLHSAQFAAGTLQVSTHSKAVPEPYTNSQFTQGTGEFILSAKGTMGNSTSAKQSVGPFPSTTEPLRSIQNTQPLLGSLQSGQSSLGVSRAAEGPVDSSLFSQGSLDLSVSAQGTLATLLCNQGTRKHPASSQYPQNTSQSVQNSLQYPPSVPGSLKPSQSEKSTLGSLSSPAGIGISSPGSQEMFQLSASSGHPEPLLYFGLPLELSMCAQGTLCPFSSPQGELDPLHCFSGNLESSPPAQMNVSHVSSVREPVGNSPSVPDPREPSPFITKCLEDFHHMSWETLGLYSLGLGSQATSQCAQGTVGSCLSPQESMELSTSAQRSLEHPPPAQRLSGTSSHTQHTCSQSMSAQSKAAYSSSTQYLSHHAKKIVNTLKSNPEFRIISITAQASVETLLSPQESPRYSSSIPGVCKISTATRGHVVSDDGPLELFISAQANLSPFHSSQCLLKPSLSVERTFGLSTPMHGTLGPSVSSLGNLGSRQYAKSVQQTNPSASDSLGSMPSSKGQTVISLSGQGTLSTFLEPLKISLSVQVSSRPSLSLQEPGESCLSLHGENTLEGSTCAHSNLVLSNSSRGDLGPSSSTPVTLGSSPPAKVDLGKSPSVWWTLTHPFSAQGFQGTSTSAQEVRKPSLDSQGRTEPLPNSQDDLGLGSLSLGTEGNSQFSKEEFKDLPSAQGGFKPALSTPGSVEKLLSASRTQMIFNSTLQDAGSFSLSSKNNSELSISSKKHLASSPTTKTSLKHSPSSQESWGPTPSTSDTLEHSLQTKGGRKHLYPQKVMLQNLSSSKVTLETSSSLQKDREGLLDVHGAQQLQAHSPGYLGHCQYTPQSSDTLTSPQMVFKCSESSSQTLETLPPLPGTLGHSLSSQSAVFPFDSDQQIQESSSSLQKSVHFSPSSKGSLRPTPSVLGTSQSLLSAQSCPKLSISPQRVLGSSPPQQGCLGDSLSMQGALGTLISAQEFVGHSKSDQESPEMFISSQENPGPSLFQEALVHPLSLPQDCGLSQSSRDMLGTSLSTQGARRTPSSVQVSILTVPLAQSVLEFQTSLEHTLGTSQLASETTKPLPSSEEVYSILKSLSRSIESLTSILETLTFSTFAKGAASPSKSDQVILRSPTVSHKTLEFSPSDQQSVKIASSQMGPDRTSLTDKGLQEISSGEKVPLGDSPLQQICS